MWPRITPVESLQQVPSYLCFLNYRLKRLEPDDLDMLREGNHGTDLVVPLLPKASDGSSLRAVRVNNSTSPRWREGVVSWKAEMNRIWCPVWGEVYIYTYIHIFTVPACGLIAITQEGSSTLHDICAICQPSRFPDSYYQRINSHILQAKNTRLPYLQ
jgi:hypothetical protein